MELWKRVTVGPDVFEALSSEERIAVLKLLDQHKQMTGTDVANILGISKSSAFKQLNRLARAGLVQRMDEGRKWIYYRNTSKAERLLHPEDVTITLVLSAAFTAVIVGLLLLASIQPIMGPGTYGTADPSGPEANILMLGHPTLAGSSLLVSVFSGSAELRDLSIFVSNRETGGVVASAPPADAPRFISYGSVSPGGGPSVRVNDHNTNGLLDAGDLIAISGVAFPAQLTLWVTDSAGAALAYLDLAA